MVKAIILQADGQLNKDLKLVKTDNIVIIGTRNSSIPLELAQQLFESSARLEYVENGTVAEYAFLLGKLSATEGISSIITDYDELQELITPGKKKKRQATASAGESSALPKKRNNIAKEISAPADNNPPTGPLKEQKDQPGKEKKNAGRPRAVKKTGKDNIKSPSMKTFGSIKKEEIEDVLKKSNLDVSLSKPVMDALSTANDVTLEVLLRTQVAGFCETEGIKDRDIIAKVYTVIANYIKQR